MTARQTLPDALFGMEPARARAVGDDFLAAFGQLELEGGREREVQSVPHVVQDSGPPAFPFGEGQGVEVLEAGHEAAKDGERVLKALCRGEAWQAAVEQHQCFVEQIHACADVHVRNFLGQEDGLDGAVRPDAQLGSSIRAQAQPAAEHAGRGRTLLLGGERCELGGVVGGRRAEVGRDSDRNTLVSQRADSVLRYRGAVEGYGVESADSVSAEVRGDRFGYDYVLLLKAVSKVRAHLGFPSYCPGCDAEDVACGWFEGQRGRQVRISRWVMWAPGWMRPVSTSH
ncbi:hypothetical protein EES43_29860 [Streptomyces sp. ADI96-02]|nr:hypothetical protein EES43_29860 [Streptomyces sp. ADI96-02]